MRIIIDLQGGQASNRNRGIGRYSLSLTRGILENKKGHEIVVVLSSLFLDTVQLVKDELIDLIDENKICVWDAPSQVSHIDTNNDSRRKNAELIRETFIASLNPDIVLVTSLFEGLVDDAITSVKRLNYNVPTAIVLYDLIPLINSSPYLDNVDVKRWYEEKISYLKKADLLVSISESSRQESLKYLDMNPNDVVNIRTASDEQFQEINIRQLEKLKLYKKYDINNEFLMYTGGIDHRKNIEGLIRAYALLDKSIRDVHQLAIVCSINDDQKKLLNNLALSVGLSIDEVVFTGFIPEDDLIALYNLCKAFIFPSWHEGFGLPALEAMNCGAPVIVSNRSSLPEVVENDDALFNSLDDEEMSQKIEEILTNKFFREQLIEHNKTQVEKFSWKKTAIKAIESFENYHMLNKENKENNISVKKKLAYLSPLQPQRSGISDYSAELLLSLIKHYDIDVIVDQKNISDNWIMKNCKVQSVEFFKKNSAIYDRTLYHFGNNPFHKHMFRLLDEYPGTVVLHDFYLGHVIDSMSNLNKELYYSHGYKPFVDDGIDNIWNYPSNKRVLDHAKGVIVHSQNSIELSNKWYGDEVAKDWQVIPLLRVSSNITDKKDIRKKLEIEDDAFVVCSFGLLGQTKQNQKLLDAWINSTLSKNKKSYLIFVGANDSGEYGLNLERTIKNSPYSSQVKITGWTNTELFREYLSISDIGVQLRTMSRGETSAAVLDCMNYGLATIVNTNGSMADLDDNTVYKIQDEFTLEELQNALEELYENNQKRSLLGEQAKKCIVEKHSPEKCAKEYFEAIEVFYENIVNENDGLIDAIVNNDININDDSLKDISNSISKNHPYRGEKQLFVDVSQLVTVDSKSGIQRVVKSILKELLENPPKGYRIEPMHVNSDNSSYIYANTFTCDFLSYEAYSDKNNLIDFKKGDIFLGLDLSHDVTNVPINYFKVMKAHGVKIHFVVYDILPILYPSWWPEQGYNLHKKWLERVVEISDTLVSISCSVKNDIDKWIEDNTQNKYLNSTYFHLGADIDNSKPSLGLPSNARIILNKIESKVTFLMVGTLEPRKGHLQTVKAFTTLWNNNIDINLVIVGKYGWMVDELVNLTNNHSELNKRLFWLDRISDEYLQKIYNLSNCLIAASEGEGFGLPLIEAAQKKLPIIARDIPVFREVAGEYAYYFENDNDAEVLSSTITAWLELYKNNTYPKSDDMPWLTWEESAKQLLDCLKI